MSNTDNRPKTLEEHKAEYYTTTFSIPVWLGEKLKDEAEEKGLRGMNRVVEIACVNYFLGEEKREEHNRKVKELLERGSITSKEKEDLWLG